VAQKWPVLAARVTIDSTNNVLRVTEDGADTFDCTIAVGDYYLAEDDTQTGSLLKAIKDALDAGSTASGSGHTYGLTYEALTVPGEVAGQLTITTDGTSISILGSHANTTFDTTTIGILPATTGPVTSGYTFDHVAPWPNWVSNQVLFDNLHDPQRRAATFHETPGGQTYVFQRGVVTKRRMDRFSLVCEDRIRTNLAAGLFSQLEYNALERWWEKTVSDGRPFRLYWVEESSAGVLDELVSGDLLGTYVLDERHYESPPAWQMVDDARLYDFTLYSREYKA
jgi:hypothetical protein